MKLYLLLIIYFGFSLNINSQNIEELNKFFYNSDFYPAINLGTKIIEQNPTNTEALYILGLSYKALNKYQQAEVFLQKAYSSDTLNIKLINTYAKILKKNKQKAINLYKKTLHIDSLNYTALNNLSKLYFEKKDFKNALKISQKLLIKDSTNSYYHRNIGYIYVKLKQRKKAIKYYKKAYLLDSTNNLNIKALASIYLKTSMPDKAIEICKKGIKNDSLYSKYYKISGDAYFAKEHLYRAIPQYKKAIHYGDSSYNVIKRLGMALCDTKEYKDALKYNIEIFQRDSNSYSNSFYLSKTYLGLKQYDKCIEYSEKTLKILEFEKRASYYMYNNMAESYDGKKEYKKALNMYDKKYNIFETRYIDDNYKIAKIHDKLGNKKTALKYYKIIAKLYNKHNIKEEENEIYKYVNQRIRTLKEDLFFEGN